jgi:hypothetical protein
MAAEGKYDRALTAAGSEVNMLKTTRTHTHQTVSTEFVDTKGMGFAYRRFGKAGGIPPVFSQHLTGKGFVSEEFRRDMEERTNWGGLLSTQDATEELERV